LYRLARYDEATSTELTRDISQASSEGCGDAQNGDGFRVTVDSFQRGQPVMFLLTVRRGDAVWHIRRRFGNVWAVHTSLMQGCGRDAIANGLPTPPPRFTPRSVLWTQQDPVFLERRSRAIERYFAALFAFIPCVEQCEALYMFLTYVNLPRWEGDSYMVGGGAPPVDARAVAKLPKAVDDADVATGSIQPDTSDLCVICQESMDIHDKQADIRILPCGHQFHFGCISGWLKQRNTCCVCNGPAVPTAPHFNSIVPAGQ